MKLIKKTIDKEKERFNLKLFVGMIIINVVLYIVFRRMESILWMDTVGTFIVAYYIGPISAFATGIATYLLIGIVSKNAIKFFIINSISGVIFSSIKKIKKIELLGESYLIAIVSTALFSTILFINNSFSPQLVPIIFISQLIDKTATVFISSFFMTKKKKTKKKKEVYIIAKTQ